MLQKKVLREYKSNKSNAIKKKRKDWNENTFVNAVAESENVKLTFLKKMLNESKKRKKSDKIFVINNVSYSIDYNNLLINIEVFKVQKIQDNLRRLVQAYSHVELSLLKMNY